MDNHELPVFEPVGLPPVVSYAEMLHGRQLRPERIDISKAEALCHVGDAEAATARITQLLQKGTHVQNLKFCLLGAVLSNSERLVQMLLNAGVPASLETVKAAIENSSLTILSLFLKHGWDINREEDWCLPPLLSHALATDPNETLISWFLSHGADPNMRCQMDITPLSTAVGCAPLPIVQQLFASCPLSTSFHGQLLHWAARRTSEDADDVVRLVLDRCKPDVNSILYIDDPFSYEIRKVVGLGTALHEASRMGLPSVAEKLIENGADASICDSRGSTALEVAESYGNHAVIDLLRSVPKDAAGHSESSQTLREV